MSVSLLVVNYNTQPLLERLLETLHSDYEEGVWELYISDNASTDGSVQWLQENSYKYKIKSVFFNENIGYSAAINNMASQSDSEFLCAVNADTWFTTNHVKQVIESFRLHPAAGVIGVKQMDEYNIIRHGGIFWSKDSAMVHRGWNEKDPKDLDYKDVVECATVSGSIYYMRREAWNDVFMDPVYRELFPHATGAFLPTFMYFEETFFSMAVQAKGWKVLFDGTVETAGHRWHASNAVGSNVHHFEISRDIYRYACQHMRIRNEFNDHLVRGMHEGKGITKEATQA